MKTEFLLIPNALDGQDYVVNLGKVREIYIDDNTHTAIDFGDDDVTYLNVPISTVIELLKQYRENA